LSWSVSNQINNSHYEIEHSTDGSNFETIGKVNGDGNLDASIDYTFRDEEPAIGDNYYRIKQVDLDGKYSFSNVVYNSVESSITSIYPNPVQSDWVFINSQKEDHITIYNVLGVEMLNQDIKKGSTQIDISNLQQGMYLMKSESGHLEWVIKE